MAINDGPGIRTTVFFKGCNLSCPWCHNPEGINCKLELIYNSKRCITCNLCAKVCKYEVHSFNSGVHYVDHGKCVVCGECVKVCPSKALKICGYYISVDEIVELVMKDKIFYDYSDGGITISGGEPFCQYEFLKRLVYAFKSKSLDIILDTNGNYDWSLLEEISPFINSFRFDLKNMNSDMHRKVTGAENSKILNNLISLSENGLKAVIVFPLIPKVNDTEDNINLMIDFISSLPNKFPLNVLPYHDFYISKAEQLGKKCKTFGNVKAKKVNEIIEKFKESGIEVIKSSSPF
jgi:pyruvate formate lyase activating enzyme